MWKSLMPMYLVTIFVSLFVKLLLFLATKFPILDVVGKMATAAFIFVLVATFLYTFFLAVQKFYTNLLKDQGYLTHTLPVKKTTLVNSKIITNMLFIIVSAIVILIALAIVFYTPGVLTTIQVGIAEAVADLGISAPVFVIGILVILLMSYLSNLLMFYVAIAIGHTANTDKIAYSVIAGLVVYTVSQFVSLMSLVVVYVIDPNVVEYLSSAMLPMTLLKEVVLCSCVSTLLLVVGYYIGTTYTLKHKLNLE